MINAQSLPTYQQFKVKKTTAKKKECRSSDLEEKQSERNIRSKCYALS